MCKLWISCKIEQKVPPYLAVWGYLIGTPPDIGARGATRTRDPLLRKLRFMSSTLSKMSFWAIWCVFLRVRDCFQADFCLLRPAPPIIPARKVYIRYPGNFRIFGLIFIRSTQGIPKFPKKSSILRAASRLVTGIRCL